MSNKTCIVLVGAPCSGKSSAGKLVAPKMNAGYISSGDIARKMAKYNAQIGNDLSEGKMAPEDEMRECISAAIWHHLFKLGKDIIILDGFPRFGDQANWLQNEVALNNINIHYVLFDVRIPSIIERSARRGRNDDKSLVQRLKYYYNTTLKDLQRKINIIIDTEENTVEECSALLTKYIEEVRRYC